MALIMLRGNVAEMIIIKRRMNSEMGPRPLTSSRKPLFCRRNMFGDLDERCEDALALIRESLKPSSCIIVTCDAAWPGFKKGINPGERLEHRPDQLCRVFEKKSKELLRDHTNGGVMGQGVAHTGISEFQSEAFPMLYSHIADEDDRVDEEDADDGVPAVIPEGDKRLWKVAGEYILQKERRGIREGPCKDGDGNCNKHFPKLVLDKANL